MGGTTGQFIEEKLKEMSVTPRFVKIQGDTRNCIAIVDSSGNQTELLEAGPNIREAESKLFIKQISELIRDSNIHVLAASGSLPKGLGTDYYKKLIEIAHKNKIKFVLDTSGDYLKEAIKAAPYLIKPNISELEDFLGMTITSEEELISGMYKLQDYSIEMVVVSLGENGCLALCGKEIYKVYLPKVYIKSAVGSGDAMLAGMLKEIQKESSYQEILKTGCTCGVLNAMNEKTGTIDTTKFAEIYSQISVKRLE
nr:1-phosphofructokinase family hexose kinase [Desulforamulus aquiferis]